MILPLPGLTINDEKVKGRKREGGKRLARSGGRQIRVSYRVMWCSHQARNGGITDI